MFPSFSKSVTAMSLVCLAVTILIGCHPGKDKSPEATRQADVSSRMSGSNTAGNGSSAPMEPERQLEQRRTAERLLMEGKSDEAFMILETMAAESPSPDGVPQDLRSLLIEAHTKYIDQITAMTNIPELIANHLLYSHYSRILQLDPENADAKTGLDAVKSFYENQKLPLPDTVNPTETLADAMKELGERPADQNPSP